MVKAIIWREVTNEQSNNTLKADGNDCRQNLDKREIGKNGTFLQNGWKDYMGGFQEPENNTEGLQGFATSTACVPHVKQSPVFSICLDFEF